MVGEDEVAITGDFTHLSNVAQEFPPLRHLMALGGASPSAHLPPPASFPTSLPPRPLSPLRHSRALLGNPVFQWETPTWIPAFGENDGLDFLPAVILGASPGIQALPSHSSGGKPADNTNMDSRLLARMTDWESRCHSRALLGNPVLQWETPTWIPAFGENDGLDFLPAVILGASPGIQALPSHSSGGKPADNTNLDSRLLARMTDWESRCHS